MKIKDLLALDIELRILQEMDHAGITTIWERDVMPSPGWFCKTEYGGFRPCEETEEGAFYAVLL